MSGSIARAGQTRPRNARQMPPTALGSLLTLLLCLVFLGAFLGGRFTVRHVDVVGDNLPREAIVGAAMVQGHNIFTVRSDGVVARLDSLHEIAVTRVESSFPDRVTVYARLRVGMVVWRRGALLYLLDPDGRVIKRVQNSNLPVITSSESDRTLGPGVVTAVREAVRLVPPTPHSSIAGFQYDGNQGLTITGAGGWQAILGSGTPQIMATRIATLAAFLQKTRDRPQQLKRIDLRFRGLYATYR